MEAFGCLRKLGFSLSTEQTSQSVFNEISRVFHNFLKPFSVFDGQRFVNPSANLPLPFKVSQISLFLYFLLLKL